MKKNLPVSFAILLSAGLVPYGAALAQRIQPQDLLTQARPAEKAPEKVAAPEEPKKEASPKPKKEKRVKPVQTAEDGYSMVAQIKPPVTVLAPKTAPTFSTSPLPIPTPVAEPATPTYPVNPAVPAAPTWTIAQATALASYISTLGKEGLNPSDYQLTALRAAIAAGEGVALNNLATKLFGWVAEDLRDGRTPMEARKQWFVFDPDQDRYPTASLLTEALSGGKISTTFAKILPKHPDYAKLKEELAKTPVANAAKRKLIRANMDRWRWLGRDFGSQYLLTNVPEFQLRLTVNDKIVRTYRTVVGKPGDTATPQLAEMVEGVIFNPTWTVPQSIVVGEGLGAKVLGNPDWAVTAGYKATKGADGYVNVVQQPGPNNSLGLMKLDMPNRHAIFLHDTPSRHLFKSAARALSHGCVRTERATELAITLAILRGGQTGEEAKAIMTSGEYTRVGFEKPMPVYITYFTMGVDITGKMTTYTDIYKRDAPVLASLDAPRVANRSRVTNEQVIVIDDDLQDS